MYAAGRTSLLVSVICCFIGCTKTIEINRYPSFYTPDLQSIAVLPFDNDTLNARAGQYLAERLAASLRANGTYKVTGPRDLAASLGPKELEKLPRADKQAAAELIGRLDNTRAFIIGTVTTFTSARYAYRQRNIGFGYGFGYGYGYGYGYNRYMSDPYWYHPINYGAHNEGRVGARVNMVLISDGAIVSETAMHVGKTVCSDGDPPYRTPDECLVEATRRVVDKLIGRFAIVRRRVKVPLDKALQITADSEGVRIVVSLPPQCHGNPFRLEVIESGHTDVLVHREFVWSNRQREYELVVTQRQLAESPTGRTFVITLYSDYEPIKSQKTTIK